MSDWRDISSAPRDGTSVILWTSTDNPEDASYVRDLLYGEHLNEVQIGYFNEDLQEWSTTHIGKPTHWMPLPSTPTAPAST